MSEIDITYKGSTIASMDSSGTKTLLTEGKYCEDDISIVYTRPAVSEDAFVITLTYEEVNGDLLWTPDKTNADIYQAVMDDHELCFIADADSYYDITGDYFEYIPAGGYYDTDFGSLLYTVAVPLTVGIAYFITKYTRQTLGSITVVDEYEYDYYNLETMTVTPTESTQTFAPTSGYDAIASFTVNGISSTYVGTGVTQRSSADMTRNKSNITAPSGYYSAAATYNMSNCAAMLLQSVDANGLVTATYSIIAAGYQASGSMTHTTQLSSIGATTYTPSTAAQTISSQYFLAGTQTINPIPSQYIVPSGTLSITSNASGIDVTNYATADVAVSGSAATDFLVTLTCSDVGGDIIWSPDKTTSEIYQAVQNNLTIVTLADADSYYNLTSIYVEYIPSGGEYSTDFGVFAYKVAVPLDIGFGYHVTEFSMQAPGNNISVVDEHDFEYLVLGTKTITANGTYNASSDSLDGYSTVTVSVSGGGGHDDEDAIIARTISSTYENSRVTNIGNYAFASCTRLTTVSFPNVTGIGSSAFTNCISLTTVSFPNATSIGSYAFALCQDLTTASFPNATSIGASAFRSCYRLFSLYLLGSSVLTLASANAFASTPISTLTTYTGGVNGSIYVPASLYSTYSTATNWKTYSDRFVSV